MPSVEFVGGSRQDSDNTQADTSRLINCYREPGQGGRTSHTIKSVLGQVPFVDLSTVFMRDMAAVGVDLYTATGGQLYCVKPQAISQSLGSIADGNTTISSNNGTVTVAAGGTYYTWDGSTLATPTTGAFSAVGSVCYIGQYTVITEDGGRRLSWSSVADATTFDALDFATKEGRDDNLLRAANIAGRLWLFGERSTEIWYSTESATLPFQRIAGGVIDTGLKSYGLIVTFSQGAFLIGDDGIAHLCNGSGLVPVSTPAVETAIQNGEPTRCLYYEDEGHKFCVIRFNDRPAWVFDLSTREWHERAYGMQHEAWRAVASAKVGDNWFIGSDLGDINRLSRVNTDTAVPLRRRMVSNTLQMDGARFRLAELEVYARVGHSDLSATLRRVAYLVDTGDDGIQDSDDEVIVSITPPTEQDRDAKCWIKVSGDYGHNFGGEKWASLGDAGDYEIRALWRALGQYRQATVELNCTEPAEIPFNATARVRVA